MTILVTLLTQKRRRLQHVIATIPTLLFNLLPSKTDIMRIFFAAIIVLLGVNFAIELMNSSMVELIKERNEQLERAIDQM